MSALLIDLTSGVYKFRPFNVVDLTVDDVSAPFAQLVDLSECSSIKHNEADLIDLTGADDENELNLWPPSRVNGAPDRIDEMMLNLPLTIPAAVGVTEENLLQPMTSICHSESSERTDPMNESGSPINVPSKLDSAEENLLQPMTSICHFQSSKSLSCPDDMEELSKNPEARQDTISTMEKIRKISRKSAKRQIKIDETLFPEFIAKMEQYINEKRRVRMPKYGYVLRNFKEYNRTHNLQFDEEKCREMAFEILSKVRDKIQNQRFVSLEKLWARYTNNRVDPADLDPELRKKLNERRDKSV